MAVKRLCKFDGCGKAVWARDMCDAHYQRWRKGIDPSKPLIRRGDPERFLRDVVLKYKGEDCLLWPYGKANYGYAEIRIGGRKGRKQLVHRLVCEETHGPPPEGKNDAAHKCGVRLCVTPAHIRWATRTENVADTLEHGTRARGERSAHAKLTEVEVREIRHLKGKIGLRRIAAMFGVSVTTVSQIHNRRVWAWLDS